MRIGISEVMPGPREFRIEADAFLIEHETFLAAAVFGERSGQRVPQNGVFGHAKDGSPQRLNSLRHPAALAKKAAKVVVAQRRIRSGLDIKAKHFFRPI